MWSLVTAAVATGLCLGFLDSADLLLQKPDAIKNPTLVFSPIGIAAAFLSYLLNGLLVLTRAVERKQGSFASNRNLATPVSAAVFGPAVSCCAALVLPGPTLRGDPV